MILKPDFEMCECGNIVPLGCVCKCKVEKKIKVETELRNLKLITDILCDIDDAMPARPFSEKAVESWKNKYSDLLYIRSMVEERYKRIINGGY